MFLQLSATEIKQKTRSGTATLRTILTSAWIFAAPWVAVITARA